MWLSLKLVQARLYIFNFQELDFLFPMHFCINISTLYVEKFKNLKGLLTYFVNSRTLPPVIAIAVGMGNYSLVVED